MNDNLVNESGDLVNDLVNDTISRQAAVQTAERMYERCDTGNVEDYHDLMVEALTVLPSAQPDHIGEVTEMVGDTISRQAAIDAINKALDRETLLNSFVRKVAIDAVKELPPAQPEQIWETCFDCPLSHGCPKIKGCTAEQAENYASEIPEGCPLSAQPECEDAVPRASVEYICRKNTVSTNPYEHKYHDKFMQFMDDPEISDFGRWQHSNGFNTALVAVKCDLDKVPSVTPKQPGWIPWDTNTRKSVVDTLMMLYRLAYNIHGVMDVIDEDNIKRLSRWLEGEEP